MSLTLIYTIICLHFVFDWFQPRHIQNNKWHSYEKLFLHTFISTLPFMVLACTFGAEVSLLLWVLFLLFSTHFILDKVTSSIVQLFKMTEYEYGIIVITAIDQLIHLLIYFYIFTKIL